MANNVIKRIWNQNTLVNIEALKGAIFQDEDGGHTFEISGVDNSGNAISLSGTVAGVFLRPDNTDVPITGSASGGIVSVTLPAECYDVPGRFGLTVFITAENKKTCIYAAIGTVGRTSSGSVAPGTSADVVDLINQISAAVATIPASWSGLMADIAPTYSTSAAYPVGAYVYYNGDLYRCTTAITAGETWTAAHWTTAVLGNDVSDLKSALTTTDGAELWVADSYVNTYNLFDGSFSLSKTDPVTNGTLSYVVCSPVIPVTGDTYYSIGSFNNPLYGTKVNVIGVRWYNSSGTRLRLDSLYPQGGYLKWLQAPTGAVKAVVIFNSNSTSVAVNPSDIRDAGFHFMFTEGLVNFSNRDSTGQYAVSANEWIPSYIVREKSVEWATTHTVTVGTINSNYTNLRSALDDISTYGHPSEQKRFVVLIREGTYDISSYYTDTEKAQSGFVGLTVPDWVTLKGIGNREKTILQYVLETASNNICVLNLMNTCGLENLTLYGVKTRYCVHDDKANYNGTPYQRYCKNVHFKGDTMTLGAVYGAGINSNAEWVFEDCIFESLTESNYQNCFSVHGSGQAVQVASSSVLFDNCRFIGHGSSLNNALILSTLMDNASYFQNYCKLQGCSANGRLILREENASTYGAGIAWWATGYATTFTEEVITNTDSVDYSDHIDII